MRPVIALFATIHLSLVQSVLESLLLLGMIGDMEQSKAVNICLVSNGKLSEGFKPDFVFKKKTSEELRKLPYTIVGKCLV